MATPVPTLADAIDRLYDAFAAVPRPSLIDGCSHCVGEGELAALLGAPVRHIPPDALSSYADSAFLTVEGDGYRYFLPRILEVTATEPWWWPDPEVTGRAIRSADPTAWPATQRDALAGYLAAVVGEAVRAEDDPRLDGWVCAIGRMGLDVRPYLDLMASTPAAVRRYYAMNADTLSRGRLSNAFWEPADPAHDAVVAWFGTPVIARLVSASTGRNSPPAG